jgi:DNA-binding transcriptional regulator YiaG
MSEFTKLPDLLNEGEYMKLVREDSGYTLEEIASMLNVTHACVVNWEVRNRIPRQKMNNWREAMIIMLENRSKACSRHIARITSQILEDQR